jgi:hypothetical protein
MSQKSIKKTSTKTVKEFLTKTGFILEMQIAESLRNLQYTVKTNRYFHDYEEDKKREIDIIATKKVNDVTIFLVIECKQSLVDDWIFIHSDQKPSRYFQYAKHWPQAENLEKTGLFSKLHSIDSFMPLTQNYIIKNRDGSKSKSIQVETCLEKLPKALVHFVYSAGGKSHRMVFFSIAVFNGPMFIARYNKKLQVKEVQWLQYESTLESYNYTYHWGSLHQELYLFGQNKDPEKEPKNSEVADTSRGLGNRYLIDFVTKKGLLKLISKIEQEITKLDLTNWPIQIEPNLKKF